MSKHTPGEWLVDPTPLAGDGRRVTDTQGRTISFTSACRSVRGRAIGDPIEAAEARANAEIFAAAPALMGALCEMLEMIDEPPERNCSCHINPPCGDCVENSGLRTVRKMARAAIAKAEGRS